MQLHDRAAILPLAALHVIIGEHSELANEPSSSRPGQMVRRWPCGCIASYRFDAAGDASWLPCAEHKFFAVDQQAG